MLFAIRKPLPLRTAVIVKVISFLIPIAVWCAVSYVPWIWHPQVKITDRGGTTMYRLNDSVDKADFAKEQERLQKAGKPPMQGHAANPIFLPAPHEAGQALWKAFTTEPARKNAPWLHERVLQSLTVLAYAFLLSAVIAVPLGLMCGTFDLFSKLIEPFVDFMRYMPAPAFGALMVAIFGMAEAPKVSIIFIGLFFNMLLVTANTARTLDPSLLEAAQVLGAKRRQLISKVVLPGTMPLIYNDLRIALGFGWVYLAVAELIGEMSGITEFINQNGKFRNYPNVFAGIIIFGLVGFITDQVLAYLGRKLFPWHSREKQGWVRAIFARRRARRREARVQAAADELKGVRDVAANA
jgi:NitT/TauT family transport system permease protein